MRMMTVVMVIVLMMSYQSHIFFQISRFLFEKHLNTEDIFKKILLVFQDGLSSALMYEDALQKYLLPQYFSFLQIPRRSSCFSFICLMSKVVYLNAFNVVEFCVGKFCKPSQISALSSELWLQVNTVTVPLFGWFSKTNLEI